MSFGADYHDQLLVGQLSAASQKTTVSGVRVCLKWATVTDIWNVRACSTLTVPFIPLVLYHNTPVKWILPADVAKLGNLDKASDLNRIHEIVENLMLSHTISGPNLGQQGLGFLPLGRRPWCHRGGAAMLVCKGYIFSFCKFFWNVFCHGFAAARSFTNEFKVFVPLHLILKCFRDPRRNPFAHVFFAENATNCTYHFWLVRYAACHFSFSLRTYVHAHWRHRFRSARYAHQYCFLYYRDMDWILSRSTYQIPYPLGFTSTIWVSIFLICCILFFPSQLHHSVLMWLCS